MGNPLRPGVFDFNADSYGRYGANVGIYRLMRALGQAGISANVFTSGVLAERDPNQVRAVADAGHEIVCHGYAQDLVPATLTPEEDEDYIRRATSALAQVIGKAPTGWIGPRATLSLVGWSKTLAREIGRDGVTTNIVLPGRIATSRILFLDRSKAERENPLR